MHLNILTKKETETLESCTVPIEALTQYQKPFIDHYFRINCWYQLYNLTTSSSQKEFVKKLSELIKHKPLYSKNYEYRTAVWGLEWEEEKFVLYRSERGLQIQVKNDFEKKKLERFLLEFSILLGTEQVKNTILKMKKTRISVFFFLISG